MQTGAGKGGISYSQVVMMDRIRVEVYIATNSPEINKHYFDQLLVHKETIENLVGKPLDWQRLDSKTASRICFSVNGKGLKDKDHWPSLHNLLVDEMYALSNAFQVEIDKLQ